MTAGQLITSITLVVAALIAVVGIITGVVYFLTPFSFTFAGYIFTPAAPLSMAAAVVAISLVAVPLVAAAALVWIQQVIAGFLVSLEMSRLAYCERQIRETFGSEASQRWLMQTTRSSREEFARNTGRLL